MTVWPVIGSMDWAAPVSAAIRRAESLRCLGERRDALLARASRCRNLRKAKAAANAEAELRAVVMEILVVGRWS